MNIPQETLDAVLALLSGQGGGAVVVGILMATVKSFWKPENKQLYLIVAHERNNQAQFSVYQILETYLSAAYKRGSKERTNSQ